MTAKGVRGAALLAAAATLVFASGCSGSGDGSGAREPRPAWRSRT